MVSKSTGLCMEPTQYRNGLIAINSGQLSLQWHKVMACFDAAIRVLDAEVNATPLVCGTLNVARRVLKNGMCYQHLFWL